MKIGADRWLNEEGHFDSNDKRVEALRRHKAQRAEQGMSWYDWINAENYIAGIIAMAARKFAFEGVGYPGYMTEEEWPEVLKTIYEPLEAYCNMDGCESSERQRELTENAQEAIRAFADYMPHFWD